MNAQLKKNVFARLFPAMAAPDISSAFLDEQDEGMQQSDPDRPAPSTPTTRRFEMPKSAYSKPTVPDQQSPGIATIGGHSDIPASDDPLQKDLSILERIGQASAAGRSFADDEARLARFAPIENTARFGEGPPVNGQSPMSGGTNTLGQPYDPDQIDDPPPLPESMRPKSAQQAAKDKYREVLGRKVEDRDKGFKGRAYEAIANALEGMSMAYKANPNGHWGGILAGGAAGAAIGGTLNRTWNEQREHEKELGVAKREYDLTNEIAQDDEKLEQARSKREVDAYEAMTKREKMIYEALDGKKKAILDQIKDLDEIDPSSQDPLVRKFVEEAAAAGITVMPKKKGAKFTFNVTPDGQLIIGDTTSGAYKKGEGNYSKPPSFSANELPDSMFGIKDDKSIDDEATAAVSKDFPNRRLRPEIARGIGEMKDEGGNPLYMNPDGSVNEAKAMADGVLDERGYENGPDNYEQKRAGYRNRARATQAALKAEVANFRTAVSNQRPRSDAQDQPVSKVKDLFLRIMELPPKERKAKLKAFYENLPNIRITG